MPEPHLKPCPFCGCEEVFLDPLYNDAGVQWEDAFQVGCAGCQLYVSCGHSTMENMAELWNRREENPTPMAEPDVPPETRYCPDCLGRGASPAPYPRWPADGAAPDLPCWTCLGTGRVTRAADPDTYCPPWRNSARPRCPSWTPRTR